MRRQRSFDTNVEAGRSSSIVRDGKRRQRDTKAEMAVAASERVRR